MGVKACKGHPYGEAREHERVAPPDSAGKQPMPLHCADVLQ